MSDTPITPHGDEALEARIVSWVLGEASAFEAAELERLCEERPELLVFKRRMRVLHGLLTEAEASKPDEGWKLPEEKRRALDELFGDAANPKHDAEKDRRVNRSGRRALLAIAACLVLTMVVLSLLPGRYEASTTIEVSPYGGDTSALGAAMNEESVGSRMTPQFFGTEFEKIKSRNSLEKVVDTLGLATRWGVDKEAALKRVKESIETKNIRGTDLIEVRAREKDPGLAKQIAGEVTKNYLTYRREVEQREARQHLAQLDEAVRELEDRVEERRKVLGTIVRSKEISSRSAPDVNGRANDQTEQIRRGLDSQDYVDAKSEFENDQELLRRMKLKKTTEEIATHNPSGSGVIHEEPIVKATSNPIRAAVEKLGGLLAGDEMELAASDDSRQSRSLDLVPSGAKETKLAKGVKDELAMASPPAAPMSSPVPLEAPVAEESSYRFKVDSEAQASGIRSRDAKGASGGVVLGGKVEGEVAARSASAAPKDAADGGFGIDGGALAAESTMARRDELPKDDQPQRPAGAAGWGGANMPDDSSLVAGNRSGDSAITRNRIDSILNDSDRAAGAEETEGQLKFKKLKQAEKSQEVTPASDGFKAARSTLAGEPEMAWDSASGKAEIASGGVFFKEMHLSGAVAEMKPEAPKPEIAKLIEEISTAEDPFSTFSLNISDASFQVAQAAIAKGGRPDPSAVMVEQFYNAVDYGDPAPEEGEPVALALGQCAHPVIPGRVLVRVSLKTAAAGRSAGQPLRLTLLVDQSGSMVREDRREAMEKALAELGTLLTAKDSVTVIGFSRVPRLLAEALPGDKAGDLAALVNQSASEGGTNLDEALRLGERMALRSRTAGARNRIVLFTDGAANLGDADPVKLAERVGRLRQQGIAFDIAGIAADGINDGLLGELARHGDGRYHVVGRADGGSFAKQLAGAFRPAAEDVKVQVRFNPERVGRYRLIGFEKDRLRNEDFRNDAVDAAELAAEEAGVAIYQVEPLPGGKGELGEVSVRFFDTAGARRVERSWTIPHEPSAAVLERAAPPMQLAVLSMLAAEKLKGGPLADAVDFNKLAGPAASVRRFYGDEGRPAEMLRLIDALK